jgi:Asp-tRNA(Asn)/Glu-tRNA(Gln) amidotransferase A subunit family amidase
MRDSLLAPAPLASTVAALRSGDLELVEYLDGLCNRIEAVEPAILSLVPEATRRERLRQEAEALLARYPTPSARPPLFGVPMGVKDIFSVNGFPTQAGSRLPSHLFTGPEASSVSRLRAAGALILGKTVTTEFAVFAPGPTRNPNAPAHTPGGSSSGSAAAVAAGIVPLALGTQTAGSVIRPAAFCGTVGLKFSYGLLPMDGVLPCAPSLDTLGLFTQDVEGASLVARVLLDGMQGNPESSSEPLVLALPTGPYLDNVTGDAREVFEASLRRLEGAGHRLVRVAVMEDLAALNGAHFTLMYGEMAESHRAWYAGYGKLYHPITAELVERGEEVEPAALRDAHEGRMLLRQTFTEAPDRAGADLWISPSALGPAPAGLESTGSPAMNFPWNYAGLPVVSLPAGAVGGLPLGIQLVGKWNEDLRLLMLARGIEQALAANPSG